MGYIVIKTIKGRQYRYEQRSWREGKRVRTQSRYLGPVETEAPRGIPRRIGALLAAQRLSPEDRALASAERAAAKFDQYQRETFGETAKERAEREAQERLDQLHALYGLTIGPTNPTPIEPASRAPDEATESAEAAPDVSDASPDGKADAGAGEDGAA